MGRRFALRAIEKVADVAGHQRFFFHPQALIDDTGQDGGEGGGQGGADEVGGEIGHDGAGQDHQGIDDENAAAPSFGQPRAPPQALADAVLLEHIDRHGHPIAQDDRDPGEVGCEERDREQRPDQRARTQEMPDRQQQHKGEPDRSDRRRTLQHHGEDDAKRARQDFQTEAEIAFEVALPPGHVLEGAAADRDGGDLPGQIVEGRRTDGRDEDGKEVDRLSARRKQHIEDALGAEFHDAVDGHAQQRRGDDHAQFIESGHQQRDGAEGDDISQQNLPRLPEDAAQAEFAKPFDLLIGQSTPPLSDSNRGTSIDLYIFRER